MPEGLPHCRLPCFPFHYCHHVIPKRPHRFLNHLYQEAPSSVLEGSGQGLGSRARSLGWRLSADTVGLRGGERLPAWPRCGWRRVKGAPRTPVTTQASLKPRCMVLRPEEARMGPTGSLQLKASLPSHTPAASQAQAVPEGMATPPLLFLTLWLENQ